MNAVLGGPADFEPRPVCQPSLLARRREGPMKTSPDVRYQAEAAATLAAERVLFPLDLAVRKPTHGGALAAARTLIGQLEAEAAQLKAGEFDIQAHSVRFELE